MPKITQLGFTSRPPLEDRVVDLGTLGRNGEVAQPRAAGRTQVSRDKVSGNPERLEPLERPCWEALGYKAGG